MNTKRFKITCLLLVASLSLVVLWQYKSIEDLKRTHETVTEELDSSKATIIEKQKIIDENAVLYDALQAQFVSLEENSIVLDRMEVIKLEGTLEMIVVWNRDYKKEGLEGQSDLQFDVIVRDFYGGYSWLKTYENVGVGNSHYMSQPLSVDGSIYYVIDDTFYGYELESGVELFRLEGVASNNEVPLIDEEGNFYLASSYSVFKVDPSGNLVWKLTDDAFDYIGSIEFDGESLLLKTSSSEFTVNTDGTFNER